jgi:hypothetical protein
MLTVEYRVNGQLIGATNIHNTGNFNAVGPDENATVVVHEYNYEHFTSKNESVKMGIVGHCREDGLEALVLAVLEQLT